jgi:hypothetical protein
MNNNAEEAQTFLAPLSHFSTEPPAESEGSTTETCTGHPPDPPTKWTGLHDPVEEGYFWCPV